MEGLRIRRLASGDARAVAALTRASPEAAQWGDAEFERVARAETHGELGWVAEDSGGVHGYVATRQAADEVEILNIVVKAASRRRGIAGGLLEHALGDAEAGGARRAFLEVRESNRAAMALYQRHGFHAAGRRARYYGNPVEDAVILARKLGGIGRSAVG